MWLEEGVIMNKIEKEQDKRKGWMSLSLIWLLFFSFPTIYSASLIDILWVFIAILITIVSVIVLLDVGKAYFQVKREQADKQESIQQVQSEQRMKEQEILEKKKKEILEKWVD